MNFSDTESDLTHGCDIASVGRRLKGVREDKGESLDNVSKITRIGKNYLAAIEEGDSSRLPNHAYTRGFIRLYASHLGISSEELLCLPVNSASMNSGTDSPPLQIIPKTGPKSRLLIAFAVIAALTLLLFAGYALLGLTKTGSSPDVSNRTGSPPASTPQKPDPAEAQSAPAPPRAPAGISGRSEESPLEGSLVLRLKAVSDGKIHITIDNSVSQEYDLAAGDLVEWKAENNFTLELENAASVEGELDGAALRPFGESGKSANLFIRKDGIHKK